MQGAQGLLEAQGPGDTVRCPPLSPHNDYSGRQTLRCPHTDCGLVQFPLADRHCRRCRRSLDAIEVDRPIPLRSPMAFVPIRRTTMFANYDQSLPFVLYWVRIRQGLSQTDVARRAHVHRLWISNVETGDKCPAINGLEKLAGALGVKVSHLLRMCEVLQGR